MTFRDPTLWMWEEALELIDQAERLQRRFFRLQRVGRDCPSWEPPVDVFQRGRDIAIVVALPGVRADQVEIGVEGATLVVRGERSLPGSLREAQISRLEIPHGYFERRIELPPGEFRLSRKELIDGCLTLTVSKETRSG